MLAFPASPRGRSLSIRARAKVNLGLEVLGRRADGYHELRSLLWAVDLADRVTLETTLGGTEVRCGAPGVPEDAENLAWRAAELFRRESGVSAGVRIRIDKMIPVAGGLGGGSADAAAVLLGLGRLWGVRLPQERLQAMAVALGMDVPFFLGRGPVLASGRGEVLETVEASQGVWLVVVNPGLPLATRDVYGRLRPSDFGAGDRVRALAGAILGGARAMATHVVNDLEAAAGRLWPGLVAVKAALQEAGCLAAVMSGSGPTVVGLAPSRDSATRVRAALIGYPWRTWVTRTVPGPALTWAPGRPRRTAAGRS